jgi:hypothetical protein
LNTEAWVIKGNSTGVILFLHFGVHRTGTTALQKTLLKNAPELKRSGILYPDLGLGCNHAKISWGLISQKVTPKWLSEKLREEMDESVNKIIMSHEDFSLIENNHWLEELSKYFEVRVVVYLRRQELWLESWYNQHIKWPWKKMFSSCTPEFFLENMQSFFWIDYSYLISKIAGLIDRDHIYVNVLDALGTRDTTADFLNHVDIECDIAKEDSAVNASISSAKLDILRRINLISLKKNDKAKYKIISELKSMDVKEDNGSTIVFNDEQVKHILSHFEASNKIVAQTYFGRDDLFSDPVQWGRKPCFVSDHMAYRVYIPRLLKAVAMS